MTARLLPLAIALVLLLALAPALRAQGENPASEPQMIDIPDQNQGLSPEGALRLGQSSLEKAREARERAAEADGKKAEKLQKKSEKHYEEAIQLFVAAIRGNADLADAYIGLGTAMLDLDQPEKALQAWGAGQQKAPKNPDLLYGLGRTYVLLDRPSEAASAYVALQKEDATRAADLLQMLREWGEPRAAQGEQQAIQLLAWIEEQS